MVSLRVRGVTVGIIWLGYAERVLPDLQDGVELESRALELLPAKTSRRRYEYPRIGGRGS